MLTGSGFGRIPSDALGLLAYDNDNPLRFINDSEGVHLYGIESQTETEISLRMVTQTALSLDNYLGAIVSADRQTIYWVNESEPLS